MRKSDFLFLAFDLAAREGCCSCTVETLQLFCQRHIAEKSIVSFLLHHLKWIRLTFRNALNLLINGLQLPEPPCRKWINVDFGFEGLGLQKQVYKYITRLCAF